MEGHARKCYLDHLIASAEKYNGAQNDPDMPKPNSIVTESPEVKEPFKDVGNETNRCEEKAVESTSSESPAVLPSVNRSPPPLS